ncbi:putative deoxyribonuclease TATDN2, partial [Ylistrum balloti]|uniref:putative deoxyribonuclease TATDN2 n=1 Tax=Ylistrum balloti TaxID=509963 RepID=UPI002905C50A
TVPRNYRIHCHCFTGDYESAKKWMNLFPNLYIGLTPLVTYRTATPTHEVARFIPLDRLLLETDAPYFIPKKFPKEDVQFSHPGMAITVAEQVAFLKKCSVTEVLHACRQNTRTMYGI